MKVVWNQILHLNQERARYSSREIAATQRHLVASNVSAVNA